MIENNHRGGIILAGGRSRRFGDNKAAAMIDGETMLQRVVGAVREVAAEIVVVGAAEAPDGSVPLCEMPEVLFAQDRVSDRGPLEGFVAGWKALPSHIDAAFVVGCDYPLLQSGFIEAMFERIETRNACCVIHEERPQPLCAVYRRDCLAAAEGLIETDNRSMQSLLKKCDPILIPAIELREVDPNLYSLRGVNTPDELARLLEEQLR